MGQEVMERWQREWRGQALGKSVASGQEGKGQGADSRERAADRHMAGDTWWRQTAGVAGTRGAKSRGDKQGGQGAGEEEAPCPSTLISLTVCEGGVGIEFKMTFFYMENNSFLIFHV